MTKAILNGAVDIVTRNEWGAAPPAKSRIPVAEEDYDYLEVHHGASNHAAAVDNPERVLRGYQKYHHGLGWSDIFYNLLIAPDGRVFEGRYGFRSHSGKWGNALTVCLIGNNDENYTTGKQEHALGRILHGLRDVTGKVVRVSYHRERASLLKEGSVSACPGRYAIAFVERLRQEDPWGEDVLGVGDEGLKVEALQKLLNEHYGADLDPDGIFGPVTKAAVADAQAVLEVKVDGLWGPDTQAAHEAWVSGPPVPPTPVLPPLDERIAALAYRHVLGREPSSPERKYWAANAWLDLFIAQFESSAEAELNNR